MTPLKIAFDIGGVTSRYPDQMRRFMMALIKGGAEVHILTDMDHKTAMAMLNLNGFNFIPENKIHSANWNKDLDMCKSKVMEELGLDILLDDRPDYVAAGNFIGFVLSPRPETKPYYDITWELPDKSERRKQ